MFDWVLNMPLEWNDFDSMLELVYYKGNKI